MQIVQYLLDRMKEASSWAGIAVILALVGVPKEVTDALGSNMPTIIAGIAALAAVMIPGGRATPKPPAP